MSFAKKNGRGILVCLAIAIPSWILGKIFPVMGIKGQLVGAISLGIADEAPGQRPRKDFSEVVEFR